ncbi:MAG: lysophospholipid acyltransferase family protein [Fidelibacterota bacterium]
MCLWPIWFLVTFICALIYLLVFLFIPPKKIHPLARVFCFLILTAGGQWLKLYGVPPDPKKGPYLYLFNHESMFDVFMMVAAVPHYISAVGANKQFSWLIWGFLIRRYGIIPIKRSQLHEAIRSLELAEIEIRNGVSFMIAPEGTRSIDGTMGPFKKGPFHLALNTGVTIVPVGLRGVFRAKRKTDWRLNPGILKLKFGKPLSFEEYSGYSVEELREFVRNKIVKLSQ